MSKKYFKKDSDGCYCYHLEYYKDEMKQNNIHELELFEAKRVIGSDYFYCKFLCEIGCKFDSGCGKECINYIPRNGISGVCRYTGYIYECTDKKIILKNKEKTLADKLIKQMQELGLTPNEMLKIIKIARKRYEARK
jgi:hypothetical protein